MSERPGIVSAASFALKSIIDWLMFCGVDLLYYRPV